MISDLMLDNNRKLESLLKLSDCCKALKKYDVSMKFLRKALQYAWHMSLQDTEVLIYDRMGLINYLAGDLIKAKYYHNRLMLKRLEAEKSPCKLSSQNILKKTFEMNDDENYNIYSASQNQVFPMVLAKLSITLEKRMDNSMNYSRKSIFKKEVKQDSCKYFYSVERQGGRYPSVEFVTDLSAEHQINQILEEKEFLFEIASPRCNIFCKQQIFCKKFLRKIVATKFCCQNFYKNFLHNFVAIATLCNKIATKFCNKILQKFLHDIWTNKNLFFFILKKKKIFASFKTFSFRSKGRFKFIRNPRRQIANQFQRKHRRAKRIQNSGEHLHKASTVP